MMSNFRFFLFLIAFGAFLWFVFFHEPKPDRVYVSPQSETAEQQSDDEDYTEPRTPDEIRAMNRERLRSAAPAGLR